MVDMTNQKILVWIGANKKILIGIGAIAALTGVYFIYVYTPAVSVSDPQSVITFFSACVTAYALIIGLTNIFYIYKYKRRTAGMKYVRRCLLLFSILFFLTFIVVLFVPPTPFESVMWIARVLFLAAIVVTIHITWHISR